METGSQSWAGSILTGCAGAVSRMCVITRALVEELGAGGGYAIGSGNTIAPYVPIENYLAMLDEAWTITS